MAKEIKYLFFDTEMSGSDQLVSIGFVVTNDRGEILDEDYYVIKPHKKIRKSTIAIHGITTEQAKKEGIPLRKGLAKFINAAKECNVHVGFAPQNDILALALAWLHLDKDVPYDKGLWTVVDVARLGVPLMIERGKIVDGQTPSLCSIYTELFNGEEYDQHNALSDAKATARCFWKLMQDGQFNFNAIVPYSKLHQLCVHKPQTAKKAAAAPQEADGIGATDPKPDANLADESVKKKKKRKSHPTKHHRKKEQTLIADAQPLSPIVE